MLSPAVPLALALALASCASPARLPCRYPEGARFSARLDSLGEREHAALPLLEQAERRRLADEALRQGLATRRAAARLRHLRTAVGLDPLQAAAWLELGRTLRLVGDLEAAGEALERAWQLAGGPPAAGRADLRLRVAIAQSWVHYDRGEWLRGLEWVGRGQELQPAHRELMLVKGLLEGGALRRRSATEIARDIERLDFALSDWRWIRGMADLYRGWLKEAEHELADTRPTLQHAADFWRDQALMYEQLGNWRKARRSYGRQAEALALDRRECLSEHGRPHPDAGAGEPELPVWLFFDRFPAAGSLHAYTQLALERFEAATDSVSRGFWAEAAIAGSTYGIRRGLRQPWGHAWRGRVYAQIDMPEPARADLRRAIAAFREQGRPHAPSLFWLGRLQLKEKRYDEALANLQEAVAIEPELAAAWSDLGYGRVMNGDQEGALTALDRALALDPDLAVAWYNRGLLHFNGHLWAEAAADLERAAALAPGNPEIADLLQRAFLLQRQQRGGPAAGEAIREAPVDGAGDGTETDGAEDGGGP